MEREDDYEPSAFTSRGHEVSTWESPRAKHERQVLQPRRALFEDYMQLEDMGLLTRQLALAALRAELEADDCPTQEIDTTALHELLGDGEAA